MIASAVMGLGVAMMQPALPALLPRWLEPHHIALGSAIYMNGMLMGEFIGAGITLPVLMPLLDNSWRATVLAWSLPALLVVPPCFAQTGPGPARTQSRLAARLEKPVTLRLGLLLGLSGSMFFGLNAYMGNLLEQQGRIGLLSEALFWYNIASLCLAGDVENGTGLGRPPYLHCRHGGSQHCRHRRLWCSKAGGSLPAPR